MSAVEISPTVVLSVSSDIPAAFLWTYGTQKVNINLEEALGVFP